jgi:hypothetical protein
MTISRNLTKGSHIWNKTCCERKVETMKKTDRKNCTHSHVPALIGMLHDIT